MIDFIAVGKKITLYRKEYHLTQDDLANRLFVTRQNVSKWENGTGIPSIEALLELSKIFNTTIENLLCLDDIVDVDPNNIFNAMIESTLLIVSLVKKLK